MAQGHQKEIIAVVIPKIITGILLLEKRIVHPPIHLVHIIIVILFQQSREIHMMLTTMMILMILQMTGQKNLVMEIMTADMMMHIITGNRNMQNELKRFNIPFVLGKSADNSRIVLFVMGRAILQ